MGNGCHKTCVNGMVLHVKKACTHVTVSKIISVWLNESLLRGVSDSWCSVSDCVYTVDEVYQTVSIHLM